MRLCFMFLCCLFHFVSGFAQNQIDSPELVLDYWFGNLRNAEDYPEQQSKIWFGGGPQVDQDIRERFEPLLLKAKNHELGHWKETPRGRLALIVLVDQFPRNMYRGTPEAFAFDQIAQKLTLEGLASKDDLKLFPVERAFFYLPLEHAEDLTLQKMSIEKFNQLEQDAPLALAPVFKSYAKYALWHYEIIAKFGRFPHRNATLERKSTDEEIIFLEQPNSSF